MQVANYIAELSDSLLIVPRGIEIYLIWEHQKTLLVSFNRTKRY